MGNRGKSIGTAREIADRNIQSFAEAVQRRKELGKPYTSAQEMVDKWLEYRFNHQKDGTLDEEQYV